MRGCASGPLGSHLNETNRKLFVPSRSIQYSDVVCETESEKEAVEKVIYTPRNSFRSCQNSSELRGNQRHIKGLSDDNLPSILMS